MRNVESLVLIRGMLREARHWGDFPRVLQTRFPDAEIMTPDLPGNGRLCGLTSPDTISSMTDALRRQTAGKRDLDLVAISMGGMVALDWMNRFPEEVRSAVLINTSARPLSPFYRRLRWQIYPLIIKMLCLRASQRERDILTLTSNRHRQNDELLQSWRQWQRQCPVSPASARRQLAAAARFRLPAKPTQPILVVSSSADRLVDHRCSLQLRELWQTDYRQHMSAGHDLPLDDPIWLADEIKHWFDSVVIGRGPSHS